MRLMSGCEGSNQAKFAITMYRASQDAICEGFGELLIEKGIFTKDEFLDMVKIIDQGRKRKGET